LKRKPKKVPNFLSNPGWFRNALIVGTKFVKIFVHFEQPLSSLQESEKQKTQISKEKEKGNKHTNKQTKRQTDKQTNKQKGEGSSMTGPNPNKQRNKQTDRQTKS
jgi:transglutaminase/protease-like cytokinesis protein 3